LAVLRNERADPRAHEIGQPVHACPSSVLPRTPSPSALAKARTLSTRSARGLPCSSSAPAMRSTRDEPTTAASAMRATSPAATVQLSDAQKAASASGMTMAAAGRAVSAAWAFIGGPMGAALLALTGVMYLHAQ